MGSAVLRLTAARLAKRYLTPRWTALAASLACAAAFAIFSGLLLKMLRPAVNELIVRPRPGALAELPLLIAALAAGRGLAQALQGVTSNWVGNQLVADLQRDLFSRVVRSDLAQVRSKHSGVFVSQMLFDAGLVREASTNGLIGAVQQSLTLVAAALVMAFSDWKLALIALVASPVIAMTLRRFSRSAVSAASGAMKSSSALSTAILESFDGIRVVKIENSEEFEEKRVQAAIRSRQRHLLKGDNARALAAPVSETLMTWTVAAVLAYEGWQAGLGRTNIGAFLAFFAALMMAAQAIRQLANAFTVFGQGMTAARRLFETLDAEPRIRDASGARALRLSQARVQFENVGFSYGDEQVLEDVDLEAAPGETVALVGPSGAGKSTIVNLVPRFFDVTSGRVAIDGQDVRSVTLASLRDQIGLVTQEPFLFDDTIRANIAYSRPGASSAQIEAAARAAAAHDFIAQLPLGYDTQVGEAGLRLSGGQRQRIAIARVFLKDPPILLLDEPTSALDAESEIQIQEALGRLITGRVTILIAHRLSTVRGADRVYVIDRGRIVETGAHSALVRGSGLYSRLAQAQDLDHEPVAAS